MTGIPGRVFHVWLAASCALVLLFITVPLVRTLASPSLEQMGATLTDPDVLRSVGLSMGAAAVASLLALIFGTPLAYVMARREFTGKKILESIIDLPIMIPHPVIGIAFLTLAGRNNWFGRLLGSLGVEIMGTVTGITVVLFSWACLSTSMRPRPGSRACPCGWKRFPAPWARVRAQRSSA